MNPSRIFLAALLLVAVVNSGAVAAVSVDTGLTFREIDRFLGPSDTVTGGDYWIELAVGCGERVKAGQKLAVQKNAAGQVVQEYIAADGGEVVITARPAPSVPGNTILEIHTGTGDRACGSEACRLVGQGP